MNVKIVRYSHLEHTVREDDLGTIDKILMANDTFPYWTFYTPPDDEGDVKVNFFSIDDVKIVTLEGPANDAPATTVSNKDYGNLEI